MDQYALGITLYEMIVGNVKFLPDRSGMLEELKNRGIAQDEVDQIREAIALISEEIHVGL